MMLLDQIFFLDLILIVLSHTFNKPSKLLYLQR